MHRLLFTTLLTMSLSAAAFAAYAEPAAWQSRLVADMKALDAGNRVQGGVQVGVVVRDLDTGNTAAWRGTEDWYIASMVKTPVAITVLRGVEAGLFTLDTTLRVRASDYVDGAGLTNGLPVATPVTIRFLMEQMMIHSDNTASDMLIGLVGVQEVNAVVQSLVPSGFGRITTLAEVRRQIYGQLTPAAAHLAGRDLLRVQQQRTDEGRMQVLSEITGTPQRKFKLRTLAAAYAAYYESGVNVARLDAYADLVQLLVDGKALTPPQTSYLLGLMERVETGPQRIKAGLPPHARYAHKTGTQRGKFCDSGLVRTGLPGLSGAQRRTIVVACTRGDTSLARSELALREVGASLCRSGLLTEGTPDAPYCPPATDAVRVPGAASPRLR